MAPATGRARSLSAPHAAIGADRGRQRPWQEWLTEPEAGRCRRMTTLYWYPNCSSCRRAAKWLDAQGIDATHHDLVAEPIEVEALRDLWERSGLELKRFFNTSGQSYRNGGFKALLPGMSEDEKLAALAKDGKLVKRPILDAGGTVLVGFKEAAYAASLG